MKLYKFLSADMSAIYGKGTWTYDPMPSIQGELVPCENGYHLCRTEDLVHWLGPRLFEVETTGELVLADNKVVVRDVQVVRELTQWNEQTQRLFACDCAERVLPIYEREHPNDNIPREAIRIARAYTNGEATSEELQRAAVAAARYAAVAAAVAAARYAAVAAAVAADAAGHAAVAADAARYAAAVAADAARYAAAVAADVATKSTQTERQWQTERLQEYLGI